MAQRGALDPTRGSEPVFVATEARRAAEALEQLRPERRQFIALAIVNGLSQSEIATQTGMPLGTVKTLIRRGLLHVRQMLGEEVRS